MTDEQPKKGSLKGRGREIMRGPSAEDEQARKSGWLPHSPDEQADDEGTFADDEAVLKWMEVDPEAHRPTFIPDRKLVEEQLPAQDSDAYPGDPDFDAIFGEEVPEPEVFAQAEERRPTTQTLDDVFREEDPAFDDLFGDVIPDDKLPEINDPDPFRAISGETDYSANLSTPIQPARKMTLPETGELYADDLFDEEGVPGLSNSKVEAAPSSGTYEESSSLADELFPLSEIDEFVAESHEAAAEPDELIPELEVADESLITDQVGSEEPERADRRSPETDYAGDEFQPLTNDMSMEDAPTVMLRSEDEELISGVSDVSDVFESESATFSSPFDTSADTWEEDFAPDLERDFAEASDSLADEFEETIEPEFGETTQESEFGEATEPEFDTAVDTLADEFKDTVLPEFSEATDILEEPFDADADSMSEADQRTLSLLQDMTGDIETIESGFAAAPMGWTEPDEDGDWQRVPEPDTMNEAESFVAMLESEREVVPSVRDEFVEAVDEVPTTSVVDTMPSAPTLPLNPEDAKPLGERANLETVRLDEFNFQKTAADYLIPLEPEYLPAGQEPIGTFEPDVDGEIGGGEFATEADASRGLLTLIPEQQSSDPFGEKKPRIDANEIFKQNELVKADQELLEMFVDDNRLRELFEQIEALQEEIVQSVRGDRGSTDTYQKELLDASNLLLQSRENYDEARATVYRVRADLNRERRVAADIRRYRPLILNIYLGMWIGLAVLALLGQLVISLTEDLGQAWIGQGFYPALAGVVGALMFNYLNLNKHTLVDRDFDPSHLSHYLTNPLFGFISGFLLYIFVLSSAGVALDSNTVQNTGFSPVTLLAAVGVGFYQNSIIDILGSTLRRFSSNNSNN